MSIQPPPRFCRPSLEAKTFLGKGHYGQVWQVCDNQSNPPNCNLAVKSITIPLKDKRLQKALAREIEISEQMGKLDISPRIFDHWKCEDKDLLLMKRLEGKDLEHTSDLQLEDLLDIYDLIRKMHKHDILHNDLYARNVFITPDFEGQRRSWLLDWGLSKSLRNIQEKKAKERAAESEQRFRHEQEQEMDSFFNSLRAQLNQQKIQTTSRPTSGSSGK